MALEYFVWFNQDFDVEITCGTAIKSSFTFTLQLNSCSVVDSGWNRNVECASVTNATLS